MHNSSLYKLTVLSRAMINVGLAATIFCITSAYASVQGYKFYESDSMDDKNASHTTRYVRAGFIYSIPYKKFHNYEEKFKAAPGGSIGAGYTLHKMFRADITADYRGKYKYSYARTTDVIRQKIDSTAFIFTGYLSPKLHAIGRWAQFKPYLAAGVGLSINKAGDTSMASGVVWGATKTAFTWQVGAGSTYEIRENLYVDVAYKYTDLGKFSTSRSGVNAAGQIKRVTPSTGRLTTNEVSLGIILGF